MEYIPAISLLVAFVVMIIGLFWKLTNEQLVKVFSGKNFLLLAAIVLFCIISIVHLFHPETWTADVLKVITGVLVGASAAFAAESGKKAAKPGEGSGVDITSSQFGDGAKVAGRDINEIIENMQGTIENMRGEVSQIRDSVINQYSNIETALTNIAPSREQVFDYLINTIYERGSDRMTTAVEKVVNTWQSEGWTLSFFSSDYQGVDGVFLLFTRPSRGRQSRFVYYHGSNMEKITPRDG